MFDFNKYELLMWQAHCLRRVGNEAEAVEVEAEAKAILEAWKTKLDKQAGIVEG